MVDQRSALRVKLSDLIEGMDFQSDEQSSFLNLTTGDVVSITDEEFVLLKMTNPSTTSPNGSMTRFALRRTLSKRITISRYPTDSRSMSIVLWSVSASRWTMRTCGMICVTPYVVEEHSDGSKTGCKCMGWLRIGIGTEMKRYERLPWRGVRHMVFNTPRRSVASAREP